MGYKLRYLTVRVKLCHISLWNWAHISFHCNDNDNDNEFIVFILKKQWSAMNYGNIIVINDSTHYCACRQVWRHIDIESDSYFCL